MVSKEFFCSYYLVFVCLFQLIKRRLYRLCRTLFTKNWPLYLQKTVQAINNSPNSAIGFLKPSEISSPMDDPKIDAKIGIPEDVPFQKQEENQRNYEREKFFLQVGDHVFLDFPPTTMEKGFDSPVSQKSFYAQQAAGG